MSPNGVRKRDRDLKVHFPAISRQRYGKSTLFEPNYAASSEKRYKGIQITESEGHKRARNGRYYEGGPFFTTRTEPKISSTPVHLQADDGLGIVKYNGPIVVPGNLPEYSGFSVPSSDSKYLDVYGANAIHAVDPTNPNAQAGVALGEIVLDKRVSLPGISTWRRRTELAKAAGAEYLSAQFGWLPLVSDMKNTAQSIKDGNTIMENYRSNAGKNEHREFEFPPIEEHSSSNIANTSHAEYSVTTSLSAFEQNTPSDIRVETHKTTRRWFSGSFTYTPPEPGSVGRCLGIGTEADKLFGLTLTPDVVWNLTPWSWAVDWFSNAGTVISNYTSFGLAGLVMRYGYIMEETTIKTSYSMSKAGLTGYNGPVPSTIVTQVTKRRRPANPFGFGVSWEGLSPTQLAITAALGITRL